MIVIIDYGMGNIHSVARALKAANPLANIVVSKDQQKIKDARHLVLPGQGAMPDCMKALHQSNLTELLLQEMQKKPTMGVCVGMQMLFESSEEGHTAGLGLLKGHILKFPDMIGDNGLRLKVPHMGWNQTKVKLNISHSNQSTQSNQSTHPNHLNNAQHSKLWSDIPQAAYFYFVHSYYLPLDNPYTFTTTDYGFEFTSSVVSDQLFATQFHPEKSGTVGLTLYKNFLNL
jgi:imidazole glycerol-phosphate synthase subunit HisH